MPLLNLEYWKYTVFHTFLLHAWHIELKFCIWLFLTVLQIKFECRQFASIFVGVMPLLELRILEYTVFHTFLLHALKYWAEILHMTLFFCTTDQECRQFASIFVGVMPLWTKNTGNTQFSTLFSYMLWHIELKFCIWLFLTVLQIKFECRQFLWELCPFWNLEYWKYTVFHTFLLHALTYWAEIFHMTLFNVL